jgi:hypothetical protein
VVASELVEWLNRDVRVWQPATDVSSDEGPGVLAGVDCVALAADGSRQLHIQVVRAEADPLYWKDLRSKGTAERTAGAQSAADDLRAVIERKAARIPPRDRPSITLALDSMDTPGYALAAVPAFWWSHLEWAAALGFQSIWLVAPALVQRLDVEG